MKFGDALKKHTSFIDRIINETITLLKSKYKLTSITYSEVLKSILEYSTRGGKNIRSVLLYYTYELFQQNPGINDEVRKLSAFIEFSQSYMLVHDDVIDHDNSRRGGDAMQYKYEKIGKEMGIEESKHFGESFAIIIGDLINNIGIEMILDSKLPPEKKLKVLKIISECFNYTAAGQIDDVLMGYTDHFEEKDILDIAENKTAYYTFIAPLFIGAELADQIEIYTDILTSLGKSLGIAYQTRDDILGVFGEEAITGKSAKSDLKEGKKTILMAHTLLHCDNSTKKKLLSLYGKKDMTSFEAEEIRGIMKSTGALEYTSQIVMDSLGKARKELVLLPNHNSEGWKFIYELINYMGIREF